MNAPRNLLTGSLRAFSMAGLAVVLSQCALPPKQAWHYIQSNGLLNYWSYEATQPARPPFGAAPAPLRYAARNPQSSPRYAARPNTVWNSVWGSGRYQQPAAPVAPAASNRYYAVPSENVRPTPPRPRVTPAPAAPSTRIPVEEPAPPTAPTVVKNEPAPTPAPSSTTPESSHKPANADLPYGTAVPGRPNMVNSPYAGKTQLVDVSGMGPGQTVKCPYTGKLFKVPAAQQATNTVEPKTEAPPPATTPKTGDKPQ